MDESEKLALIAKIVDTQIRHQNWEEDGDRNLADAFLAMEAIANVLDGTEPMGALRMYQEA